MDLNVNHETKTFFLMSQNEDEGNYFDTTDAMTPRFFTAEQKHIKKLNKTMFCVLQYSFSQSLRLPYCQSYNKN